MIFRFSIVFFFLVGCSSNEIEQVPEPENLINRKDLTEILTEMVKLEAHIESEFKTVTYFGDLMKKSGDSLLNAHGISKEDYSINMDYYGRQQELMQEINSDVLDELNKELGNLQSK